MRILVQPNVIQTEYSVYVLTGPTKYTTIVIQKGVLRYAMAYGLLAF